MELQQTKIRKTTETNAKKPQRAGPVYTAVTPKQAEIQVYESKPREKMPKEKILLYGEG